VRVPALVLHRRGDQDSRVAEGRYLAAHIPGARFVELPGRGTRFGLQIAEVPQAGPVVNGPGVEAAVRLAERAAPGRLLVSLAVRDLVADSGLSFAPAGDDGYRLAVPMPAQAGGPAR
jgi:class 3 adenylate cyclase